MESSWCTAVKTWLTRATPLGSVSEYEAQWDAFDAESRPVVTAFGAYDTGKSSLLRRLLADADLDIPRWLTVTARHETYDARTLDFGDLVLQDTPGIGQGTDARTLANTQVALDAARVTDLLVITLPPQLMTSEREALVAVLDSWDDMAIAFVIGRFDEAGADPETDLDGYQSRAVAKIAELRSALDLADDVPVFVVSADPFGLHASDTEIDSSTWGSSSTWDGIDAFSSWLATQPARAHALRSQAEVRFWQLHLSDALQVVLAERQTARSLLTEADAAHLRRQLHDVRLTALKEAARASLEGTVEEAVRTAARSAQPGAAVDASDIEEALGAWYDQQRAALDELRSEVLTEASVQAERPAIRVILGLDDEAEDAVPGQNARRIREFAPQIQEVMATIRKAATSTAVPTARSGTSAVKRENFITRNVASIEIAESVITPAAELFAMIAEEAERKEAVRIRAERRRQLEDKIRRACERCADAIFRDWETELTRVQTETGTYFDALAASSTALGDECSRLNDLCADGTRLMAERHPFAAEGRP